MMIKISLFSILKILRMFTNRVLSVVRESGCVSEHVLPEREQRVRLLSVVSSARYTHRAKTHII